jgi:transcriptional regulator with XRE-family HTH domain
MTFGEYLKLQMKNYNLSQNEIMEHCSVSKTSVSKWCNDHVLPSTLGWHKLALLLSGKSKIPLNLQLLEMSETLPL